MSPSIAAETSTANVISGLSGAEIELTNAVAPYDHHSNVDSILLSYFLSDLRVQAINECLALQGFAPRARPQAPEREDPALRSNEAFPYTVALLSEGLAVVLHEEGEFPGGPEGDRPSPEEQSALSACMRESETGRAAHARDLFHSVRDAWESVLAEVEAAAEIRDQYGEFTDCLLAEGIPSRYAGSEGPFLGYVDSLIMRAGGDRAEMAAIAERYGKIYATCGQALFEARESLRSGERRGRFLQDHEQTILQLADLLRELGL